jgi:hypothetical protein
MTSPTDGFLAAWARYERAARSVCPQCQFESSDGYRPSHAPDCPLSPPEPEEN